MAFSPTGPFWIVDNGTGSVTVYNSTGQPTPAATPLVVTVPAAGTIPTALPTGTVFNATTGFQLAPGMPALFLFASINGTISGWNPQVSGTKAVTMVDNSANLAAYTGLAIGSNNHGDFIYAANFRNGTIDAFNSNFFPASLPGTFSDPGIPVGFSPFNIQNLNGKLYVTYALKNPQTGRDLAGPGNGFVNVFDTNGRILQRLVSNGALNSPWGLTIAPASFGNMAGAVLVGNFGNGMINAFDGTTGAFIGTLSNATGPIVEPGLWSLAIGNGGQGGDANTLYFTAGIGGGGAIETHGLFGSISALAVAH
jgi:uncharacterized protein (TIGR03118 family)